MVDALDKCGDGQAVDLIQYFKDLLDYLKSSSVVLQRFHICFTCRPYPVLDLGIGSEICLESENRDAISTFEQDKLANRTSSTILKLIIDRADGVFLWASLVVERVLKLERDGEGLAKIEAEIHSTPPDLDKLYWELIRGMGSSSLKLIQWICFGVGLNRMNITLVPARRGRISIPTLPTCHQTHPPFLGSEGFYPC